MSNTVKTAQAQDTPAQRMLVKFIVALLVTVIVVAVAHANTI